MTQTDALAMDVRGCLTAILIIVVGTIVLSIGGFILMVIVLSAIS